MSSDSDKTYFVSAYSDPVVVRVNGRASLHNAGSLSAFFKQLVKKGKRRFIVDFTDCTGMDSTFLGILAGTALDVYEKKDDGGCFLLTNLNSRNLELIKNLGLHMIADVVADSSKIEIEGSTKKESISGDPIEDRSSAETILKAHEDLVKIDSANQERFQDVIAFLKNQIEDSK